MSVVAVARSSLLAGGDKKLAWRESRLPMQEEKDEKKRMSQDSYVTTAQGVSSAKCWSPSLQLIVHV